MVALTVVVFRDRPHNVSQVLWKGEVINPDNTDNMTKAIRNLNAKVYADERVDVCMLPTADGISLCIKR